MSHNGKYYKKCLKRKITTDSQKTLLSFGVKRRSVSEDQASHGDNVVDLENHDKQSVQNQITSSQQDPIVMVSTPDCLIVSTAMTDTATSEDCTTSTETDMNELGKVSSHSKESKIEGDILISTTRHDARRKSDTKYETLFPWMYYSGSKTGYMCKFCELFGGGLSAETAFSTTGAVLGSHPSRRLQIHENSERHKLSVERYTLLSTNKDYFMNITSAMRKSIQNRSEEEVQGNRSYITKLFKIVLFLVRNKWGHTENVRVVAKLLADLGDTEVKTKLESEINYVSSRGATEMIEIISQHIEKNLLNDLKGRKFTLFLDESTDNANRSQASIMARWVGAKGVREFFLGVINMQGTKASDFEESVKAFCQSKGMETKNIRFVALDGCSTMSGDKTGLQRRIRHMSPHSLYINCRNHRLALCFAHLLKVNPTMVEVEGLLIAVWKLFHFSPKRHAVFQKTQQLYDEKPLTFIRAAATRWLSHLYACVRFSNRYECILDTLDALLEDTREPEIEGIRAKATNPEIILTILLFTDVLKPVDLLSKYLQSDCGFFTSIDERVRLCVAKLQMTIVDYQEGNFGGYEFRKSQEMLEIATERTDFARRMRNTHRSISPQAYLQSTGVPLIHQLISEIQNAFKVTSSVLQSFSVLDPINLPDTAAELEDYGKDKIHTLVDHYCKQLSDSFQGHVTVAPPDIDVVTEHELLAFRSTLLMMKKRTPPLKPVMSVADVYKELISDEGLQACFPRVRMMYELAMLIPQSTAVVERSFSAMNDICTHSRSSLSSRHLDNLMRISLCEQVEINYDCLVNNFKDIKKRELPL